MVIFCALYELSKAFEGFEGFSSFDLEVYLFEIALFKSAIFLKKFNRKQKLKKSFLYFRGFWAESSGMKILKGLKIFEQFFWKIFLTKTILSRLLKIFMGNFEYSNYVSYQSCSKKFKAF